MLKLSEALDEFESDKTLGGRAEKTIQQYNYVLNGFGEYLGGNPPIGSIDKGDIREFLTSLKQNNYSEATVGIHYRVLNAFFNWVVREGELAESPMANISEPKSPKKYPRVLEEKHIKQLLSSAKERRGCWSGLRNLTIVMTFLEMGLRRQELLNAKLRDLDMEGQSLKVHGKGSKDRRVVFGEKMAQMMRKWLRVRDNINPTIQADTIFIGTNGLKLKGRNVARLITRMQRRAGLEDIKLSPHVLRHTSATMAVKNGMDAFTLKQQFGWENIKTANRYVHMTGERLQDTFNKTSPLDHFGEVKEDDRGRNSRGKWVNK